MGLGLQHQSLLLPLVQIPDQASEALQDVKKENTISQSYTQSRITLLLTAL